MNQEKNKWLKIAMSLIFVILAVGFFVHIFNNMDNFDNRLSLLEAKPNSIYKQPTREFNIAGSTRMQYVTIYHIKTENEYKKIEHVCYDKEEIIKFDKWLGYDK